MLVLMVIATAAATAVALGGLVRRFAPAMGAVVPQRPDRWHEQPTPTLGGIALVGATLTGFLVVVLFMRDLLPWADIWVPVPLAALAMFAVGFLDDQLQLSPLAKLVSSLVVGALLVFALSRTEPGGFSWMATLVATVWFAGVCHAMNLLDNMDGLATGVAVIAALCLTLVLGEPLGAALGLLLLSCAGAALGFLYWNHSRARLFMGDCGSLFLGAMLGGASMVPVLHAGPGFLNPAIFTVLILVVPLFDTAFVLVLRRFAGRSATRGGIDHVSHRLVSLGFSERSAVRILYLLGMVGGATAWSLMAGGVEGMLPLAAVFGVLVTLVGVYLSRVPAYNAEDFIALQKSSFAPFLKDLTFKWHAGQVMLDMVLITACYYSAYRLRFEGERLDRFLPFFTASLPVVMACKLAALYGSGLYQRSWSTFGLRDVTAVARGVGMGSLLAVLLEAYAFRLVGFSRGVFLIDAILLAAAIIASRVSFRAMNLVAATRSKRSARVLVYGAGAYGQLLVREMRANTQWNMNPVAFIDDDPMKAHKWIVGVPVRGPIDELERTMERLSVDEVILSSASVNGSVEQQIREVCGRLERPVRRLHMEIR